jgi:hypothetical protein
MRKRGRPPKFDRPSRLVAMTLPEDVIKALRERHTDLARAVVALTDEANGHAKPRRLGRHRPAELAEIGPRRFLITVDVNAVRVLPGCELVPITPRTAFLALQPGCGLADLALAVTDRLEEPGLDEQERGALTQIRLALRAWMRDKKLTHETRSIVVMRRVSLGIVLLSSNLAASASALFSECEGILQRVLPQLTDTAARAAIVTSVL